MRWSELTVHCSYQAAAGVAAILHQYGSGLVVLEQAEGVSYRLYLPESPELPERVFDLQTRLRNLPPALAAGGLPTITSAWVDEQDWAEAWKAYFKPLRVGRRLVVKPTWQPWPPPDQPTAARAEDLVIELDPGMAFGTGTHATTMLCLTALEEFVQPGMRLIDLGCGSGILTVAALKLGAGKVLAIDSDYLATEATTANCRRNEVQGCQVCLQEGLGNLTGQWDLIVANISAAVILAETPGVAERLAPGGIFICSGFYMGHEESVAAQLQAHGLRVLARREQDTWSCVIGRRASRPEPPGKDQ